MKIKLNVNQNNMMEVFGQSFRSRESVIVELLQNARRAGATLINLVVLDEVIGVYDNGKGIDNWDDLLSIYHSGWDIPGENPFGVGFKGALFICDEISVWSNGKFIAASCDHIKSFGEIDVLDSPAVQGDFSTIVKLIDPQEINLNRLLKMIDGFPVQITVKTGDPADFSIFEADRINALNSEDFTETEFGWIGKDYKPWNEIGFHNMYYLGARVGSDTRPYYAQHVTIHLDPERFTPILPDRTSLTEESMDRLRADVSAFRESEFRKEADRLVTSKEWEEIWELLDTIKEFNLLSVLNESPIIGGGAIHIYDDVRQDGYRDEIYSQDDYPTDQVYIYKGGKGTYGPLPDFVPGETGSLCQVYAHLLQLPILSSKLDDGHPVYHSHRILSGDTVRIKTVESPRSVEFSSPFWPEWELDGYDVVLCESLTLGGPAGLASTDEMVVVHNKTIYIPEGAKGYSATLQIGNLYSEETDGYSDLRHDQETEAFDIWLSSVTAKSPAEMLENAIASAKSLLPDGKFEVTITRDGSARVIEVKEAK